MWTSRGIGIRWDNSISRPVKSIFGVEAKHTSRRVIFYRQQIKCYSEYRFSFDFIIDFYLAYPLSTWKNFNFCVRFWCRGQKRRGSKTSWSKRSSTKISRAHAAWRKLFDPRNGYDGDRLVVLLLLQLPCINKSKVISEWMHVVWIPFIITIRV